MKTLRALLALTVAFASTANAALIKTVQAGATDQTVVIRIVDSTDGTPETGVAFNTSGIDIEYWIHGANSVTDITEATQTVSGAHTDGGFVSLGNGYYRLDLPDAAVATAGAVEIMGTVTGMVVIGGTVDISPPVNIVSAAGTAWASGAITAASIATDAIGAAEIAADAIGASELATDAIGAAEIAAAAIGAAEVADATIDAATFAAGAIDASAIAADAIGASELATDAIGAAEIATDAIGAAELAASAIGASEIADGGITSAEFGAGAITATVIAADAIGASEVAADVSTELLTGLANLAVNVAQVSGDATAADTLETWLDGTAGSAIPLGIVDQGTAQSATGTTLVLRSALAIADDAANGMTLVACGSTQGYCQSRAVTGYVSSTDTATVDTWTVTPSGTITYYLYATAPTSSSAATDVNVISISGDTVAADNLELFMDGTGYAGGTTKLQVNATQIGSQTASASGTITFPNATLASTTNITAGTITTTTNLTNLPAITAGWLTATGIASDAFTAAKFATDAGTEFSDAVWDASTTGNTTGGTMGGLVNAAGSAGDPWSTAIPGAYMSGTAGYIIGNNLNATVSSRASQTSLDTVDDFVDTEVATIVTQTGASAIRTALGMSSANLDTQLTNIESGVDIDTIEGTDATDAIDARLLASLASQRIIVGTCDSGSTTTCVDDALTQAATAQLDDRLICFDDSWCALITDFTPGTDTVTTTKTAPSTRSAKAYTIFPATAQ